MGGVGGGVVGEGDWGGAEAGERGTELSRAGWLGRVRMVAEGEG